VDKSGINSQEQPRQRLESTGEFPNQFPRAAAAAAGVNW